MGEGFENKKYVVIELFAIKTMVTFKEANVRKLSFQVYAESNLPGSASTFYRIKVLPFFYAIIMLLLSSFSSARF